MGTGAITQYVDVAQLVLYLFWAFFFGVIYYLVRENHREGYPMETVNGRGTITGWPQPKPKTYLLADGHEVQAPKPTPVEDHYNAAPAHGYAGAPLMPGSDKPMLDGVGPGAWAQRADVPDRRTDGTNVIMPLRVAAEYGVASQDADPRGMPVLGDDDVVGGTVVDLWLDTAEMMFRYIEVKVEGSGRHVLLPMNFARVRRDAVKVHSILGHQFADVPATREPDVITLLEEEKIMAYYGAGTLYATPERQEPLA